MSMQIHCPGCNVRLEVPADSGGRSARCPACKQKFRVPDPRTMLDETVTCWLNLDHLHREEEIDDGQEQFERPADPQRRVERDVAVAAPPPAKKAPMPTHSDDVDEADQVLPIKRQVQRVVKRSASKERPAESLSDETDSGSGVHDRKGGSFVVTAARKDKAQLPAQTAAAHREGVPHLSIVDIGAYGVRLGFDAKHMDSLAFRASMPMQGMMSHVQDAGMLIARPLAWVDKAMGHYTNTGELEARYELHVKPQQTPREVTLAMTTLEELPPPFNQPMPYYVSRADAGKVSVHCETVATPTGIRCEVTIPSIRYALDWLARVNGVCGDDYAMLETETLKFEAEAWRAIPQNVRHRLAVWFDFRGDEQFLGYFNDSDFSRSDAGLAGLVVTTERLVYCRYHHHGEINLSAGGLIHAAVDDKFATIYHIADSTRRKLVLLRSEDVQQLAEFISELDGSIEMQIETAPPQGYSVDSNEQTVEINE